MREGGNPRRETLDHTTIDITFFKSQPYFPSRAHTQNTEVLSPSLPIPPIPKAGHRAGPPPGTRYPARHGPGPWKKLAGSGPTQEKSLTGPGPGGYRGIMLRGDNVKILEQVLNPDPVLLNLFSIFNRKSIMEERTFLCDPHAMGFSLCPSSSLDPHSHIFQGQPSIHVHDGPVGPNFYVGSTSSSSLGSNHMSTASSHPEPRGYVPSMLCEPILSSVGESSRYLENYHHAPLATNVCGVHLSEYQNNHITNHGRGAFKRKSSISLVHDTGNLMRYELHGTSSEFPIYGGPQRWQESTLGFQYCPSDAAYRGGALLISGDRNVRRRPSSSIQLDPNAENLSGSSMHWSYSAGHHQEQLGVRGFGDVSRTAAMRGLSQTPDPYWRISVPDNLSSHRELQVLPAISHNGNHAADINNHNYIYGRNSLVPWQNSHAASVESTRSAQRTFRQGPILLQRPASNYPLHQHSGSVSNTVLGAPQSQREPYMSSFRLSRPFSSSGERTNYRPNRAIGRISFGRPEPMNDETTAHGRWFPEGTAMLDHSSYYGSDNFVDRHRDMRLDIDNMSYEELLALEEHIGDVSTGLSEEFISIRLQQKTYVTSKKAKEKLEEDETCIVCQEEYENRDELGTLECGHDYHYACIRQWLLLKNVCPICKATALGDGPDR
ncbi:putative E3 ubiquitin-protein ligase [Nymphaea thermarum]|nr:putative E3 ubiquitin-protein ligase [Nymphaea thermarum]